MTGRLFVGTGHSPVVDGSAQEPIEEGVSEMLSDLNLAIPGLNAQRADVVRVFWGLLPAKRPGSIKLASENLILDHGQNGGPSGLFSVSGVKFTTARSAASKVVALLTNCAARSGSGRIPDRPAPSNYVLHPDRCRDRSERIRKAKTIIDSEAPQSLVDLLIRRCNMVGDPEAALSIAQDCCSAFGWNANESAAQMEDLSGFLEAGRSSVSA